MDIRLTATFIGITDDVRVNYYETSAPSAIVATQDLAAPHAVSRQVDQYVENAVPHIVKFFRLVAGVPGAVLFDFVYDPSYAVTSVQTDLNLIVNGGEAGDPATGDDVVTNDLFGDYDVHHFFRDNGLFLEWEQDHDAKTVTLTNGDIFGEDEKLTLSFYPKISSAAPVNVVNSLIRDLVVVSANYTVDVADSGVLHAVNSENSTVVLTMPAIATIPENKVYMFQNTGGSQKITKLVSDPSASIIYNGQPMDYVYLTMGEFLWVVKNGIYLYAVNTNVDYNKTGAINYVHSIAANQLLLDGGEYSRAQYARLWEFVQGDAQVQATKETTAIVNGQTIYPYKGCYGDGDGVSTFTLPNLLNEFIRGLKNNGGADTERTQNIAGGFQGFQLQDHVHKYDVASSGGSAGTKVYGRGGSSSPDGKTDSPFKVDLSTASVGAETRGQNIGLLPVVNF